MASSISPTETRKRVRSFSASSSGASSPKRAASEDPAALSSPPTSMPLISLPTPSDQDIDAYMREQGENLSLNDPASSAPSPQPAQAPDQVLSPKARLDLISSLKRQELREGDQWFLIARKWYRHWEAVCSGHLDKEDSQEIGPIDNSSIVDSDGRLVTTAAEGVTVEIVPTEAWDLLVEWYGKPSVTLTREVISTGIVKALRIEFFPPTFKVCALADEPSPLVPLTMSSKSTLRMLVNALPPHPTPMRLFRTEAIPDENGQITPASIRSPVLLLSSTPTEVDLDKRLDEVWLESGDILAVDTKNATGAWRIGERPIDSTTTFIGPISNAPMPLFQSGTDFCSSLQSASSSKKPYEPSTSTSVALKPAADIRIMPRGGKGSLIRTRGTMGLVNLGNTCFMNSALQCLAHTEELTEYFLSNVFEDEINTDNPLGTGGALARSYNLLMRALFPDIPPYINSFSPREFKHRIAMHAPSFSGYAQHDTQELLAFLLDGLHEDLNRIIKKPYVENPDWNEGGSLELAKHAQEAWEGYKKRNDSVIVDLFQGQYKSTLVCPECAKVSITLDPFMYLTLPLPVQKKWRHQVFLVPWDPSKPTEKVFVELPRHLSFKELKATIGRWREVNPENLFAAEVYNNRFYKFFPDYTIVSEVLDRDVLWFYELPVPSQQAGTFKRSEQDPFLIPVFHVQPKDRGRASNKYGNFGSMEMYGTPFIAVLEPQQASTVKGIYEAVVDRYQRWTEKSGDLQEWTEISSVDQSDETETVEMDHIVEVDAEADTSVADGAAEPEQPNVSSEPSGSDGEATVSSATLEEAASGDIDMKEGSASPEEPWAFRQNMFKMMLNEGTGDKMETGWQVESSGKVVSWADRAHAVRRGSSAPGGWVDLADDAREDDADSIMSPSPPLLRPSDAILCEWYPDQLIHFFGEGGKGKSSLWETAIDYIDPEYEQAQAAEEAKKKRGITIYDCLEEFVKEERLGEDDLWYCPRCKKHQQATKKIEIWKVPDILVVHLKRFSNSRILRDKIDAFIEFPIEGLDLEKWVQERKVAQELLADDVDIGELGLEDIQEPLIYDLYAVDEHMGGLGGGHYRAYAKNPADQTWYHFDDAHVWKTSADEAVNSNAYLLFYQRRTTRPLGGRSHEIIQAAQSDLASLSDPSATEDAPRSEAGPEDLLSSPMVLQDWRRTYSDPGSPGAFTSISDQLMQQGDHNLDQSGFDDMPGSPGAFSSISDQLMRKQQASELPPSFEHSFADPLLQHEGMVFKLDTNSPTSSNDAEPDLDARSDGAEDIAPHWGDESWSGWGRTESTWGEEETPGDGDAAKADSTLVPGQEGRAP
ncbi:hypothetical protein BOTBODRAFT_60381 [Botryobasidium botryosum FD-172 SS1]|uniref:ubiquitinyl hydrolase 1 n=1 Tax=Botryobasidium botryosum (strain FD-172 SS1) TaxID=930990 RepID=A0A067M5M3_BOTB1|nr:hypothetical protein BOTBODRAFT_60381 [Botryobasidium botryosum FD-172 SS1]